MSHESAIKMSEYLSSKEKLAELCDCVPLALCIVGPLLSDYTEERLIKHLEEQPLAVLKDDNSHERSMENAIKTSLDLLTQAELKEAFVLMSVFSGPFNADAAEAVMETCSISESLPGSMLRALKNRSLLEQPSPRRYQMHPLIQAFAKRIGVAEYPHNRPEFRDISGTFIDTLALNLKANLKTIVKQ